GTGRRLEFHDRRGAGLDGSVLPGKVSAVLSQRRTGRNEACGKAPGGTAECLTHYYLLERVLLNWVWGRSQKSGVRQLESGIRGHATGVRNQESGVSTCGLLLTPDSWFLRPGY